MKNIRRHKTDSSTNAWPIRRQMPTQSRFVDKTCLLPVDELGVNAPIVDESVSLSTSRAPVDEWAVDELGVFGRLLRSVANVLLSLLQSYGRLLMCYCQL